MNDYSSGSQKDRYLVRNNPVSCENDNLWLYLFLVGNLLVYIIANGWDAKNPFVAPMNEVDYWIDIFLLNNSKILHNYYNSPLASSYLGRGKDALGNYIYRYKHPNPHAWDAQWFNKLNPLGDYKKIRALNNTIDQRFLPHYFKDFICFLELRLLIYGDYNLWLFRCFRIILLILGIGYIHASGLTKDKILFYKSFISRHKDFFEKIMSIQYIRNMNFALIDTNRNWFNWFMGNNFMNGFKWTKHIIKDHDLKYRRNKRRVKK